MAENNNLDKLSLFLDKFDAENKLSREVSGNFDAMGLMKKPSTNDLRIKLYRRYSQKQSDEMERHFLNYKNAQLNKRAEFD